MQKVFIGNCSKNGIYFYKLKNGKLIKENKTNDFEKCTYLANTKKYLYGVLEVQDDNNKKNGYIVSYIKKDKRLQNIDKKSSYGQGPCHIEVNEKNKIILVSNYINGYLTVFKLNDDGSIGEKLFSSLENNQKSHLHCAKAYKNGKFFFTIDLGENLIVAYEVKDDKVKEISRLKLEGNSGPRHMALSKNKLYIITEKSCELYYIKFKNKKLYVIDKISLLPKNIEKKEDYTGCAIKLSKNNKKIYTTIRGHNSISVFKIRGKKLKIIENICCHGETPRDLGIDSKGKYLLVANQNSNEVAIFKIKKITGKLLYKSKEIVESPTCLIIE